MDCQRWESGFLYMVGCGMDGWMDLSSWRLSYFVCFLYISTKRSACCTYSLD